MGLVAASRWARISNRYFSVPVVSLFPEVSGSRILRPFGHWLFARSLEVWSA